METLGSKLRKRRTKLALTLDDLADRTSISKPYLSLIETGRVTNPPSDAKLRRLEQVLGFAPGELLSQAHLQRTPADVRAVLEKLLSQQDTAGGRHAHPTLQTKGADAGAQPTAEPGMEASDDQPVDLDAAYLSGVLQEMVEHTAGNVECVRGESKSATPR